MPETSAREIVEDVIYCIRDNHAVPLSNFFVVQEIRTNINEVFVYDREFEAGKGQVIGVTTGLAQKIPLPEGIFSFG